MQQKLMNPKLDAHRGHRREGLKVSPRSYETEYKGMKFVAYPIANLDGLACFGDKRVVVSGLFKISLAEKALKFTDQIVLQVFSNGHTIEPRVRKKYEKIEINVPVSELENIINVLLEIKGKIGGAKP